MKKQSQVIAAKMCNTTTPAKATKGKIKAADFSNLVINLLPRQQDSPINNPSRDPRFLRLVAQLVPMKEKRTVMDVKAARNDIKVYLEKEKHIYFYDVCLKETCTLIYKMMKIDSCQSIVKCNESKR